jgi:hypothetical protein
MKWLDTNEYIHLKEPIVNKSKIGISTVFLMMALSSAILALGGGWTKTGELKGITGYTRPTPQSRLHEMMAVGIVDAPLADIEAVLRNIPTQKDYMYLCMDAELINFPGKTNTTESYCIYSKINMPTPVIDRDSIIRLEWTTDKSTGTRFVHGEGIKTDYRPEKNVVRMTFITLDFTLTPKGPDKTEVTYSVLMDPGGVLPESVVAMLTKNLTVKTLMGIREKVRRNREKSAKPDLVKPVPGKEQQP